jgi:hypothetical protein
MINYTLKIQYAEYFKIKGSLSNVISKIRWYYVGIDSETGIEKSMDGVADLPDPDPASFITMDLITKEIITAWIETILDLSYLQERIFFDIQQEINSLNIGRIQFNEDN